MTWFDLAALVIVGLAVWDGARHGLAWVGLEFVLMLLASLVAGALRRVSEPYVLKIAMIDPVDLPWVTHGVIFALATCLFLGVLYLVRPAAAKWRFAHDRWAGGVCGVATGWLAVLLLAALGTWSSPRPYEHTLSRSWLPGVLETATENGLAGIFPEPLPERLAELRHH